MVEAGLDHDDGSRATSGGSITPPRRRLLSPKPWMAGLIYYFGATADNLLTYFYVKLWGLYAEANPIIAVYWMDKPLWTWMVRDLAVLLLAILVCISYRRLVDFLISTNRPSTILAYTRRCWLLPLYLVAVVRCLPAVHNILLIFFGVETPLADIIHMIFA